MRAESAIRAVRDSGEAVTDLPFTGEMPGAPGVQLVLGGGELRDDLALPAIGAVREGDQ